MTTSATTTTATNVATKTAGASPIKVGPDLNDSRSPYDKKLYRLITLANGLRVVLISDTNALNQKRPTPSSSSSSSSSSRDGNGDDDVIMEEEHHDVASSRETTNEHCDENDDEKKSDGIITENEDDDDDDEDDDDDDDDDDGLRKSAAALVVNAGSYNDPEYAQGIAHFLEHMLFMGTSKYPTENAYDSFVSSHGGTTNAYTELEYTLYHFDIPQEHFFRALDMFAQFFVHPLLNEDAMERELNSIESEFELCRQNDDVRWYQMMGWTGCHRRRGEMKEADERGVVELSMNTVRHPMGKFSWGNKYSLKEVPERCGVNMVKELRNFYDTHYYASNMSLVVIGAYSIEELESATIHSFASIPSSPRCHPQQPSPTTTTPNTPPFPPPTLSRLYRLLPTRKRHTLILTFQLPPLQKQYWKSKPCDIIAHLIGHEGRGSLLSHLKQLGYATGCCAGVGDSGYDRCRGHCLFSVSLSLTLKGVEMWKDVVTCVYEYIGLLRWYYRDDSGGCGLPDYIYEELRAINEVAYKYADEGGADDTVEDIVSDMVKGEYLPEERLLDGNSLFFEFDQDIIKHLLTTYFIPTNARVDLMSSTFGKSSDYDVVTPPPNESIVLPFDNTGDATTTTSIHHPLSDSDEPPQIEPLFSTRYWCHVIPDTILDEWNQARSASSHSKVFHLPMVNPFIPTDFSLRPLPPDDDDDDNGDCSSSCPPPSSVVIDESSLMLSHFPPLPPPLSPSRTPSLLNNDPSSLRLYHLFDRKFRRPIGDLRFLLRYDSQSSSSSSLTATVISQLAVSILRDALTNITYQASVCELHASFSSTCCGNGYYGLSVRVNGFDNQLTRLLKEVVKGVTDLRSGGTSSGGDGVVVVEEGRFQRCRESLSRLYANDGMGSAKKFCGDIRLRCLMMRGALWSGRNKHKALEELTLSSFQSGISSLLSSSNISIEALYHGNCTPDDAATVALFLANLLPPSDNNSNLSSSPPPTLIHKIPMGIAHTLQLPNKNPKDNNTAVELYYQIGIDNDTKRRVIVDVLCHLMVEPFYDELRTKEQWGYDVDVSPRWTFGVVGLSFQVVTSRRRSSEDVITRIDEFLSTFRSTLSSMSNETYIKNIVGLAKNKLQAFDSLEDECSSHWSEIVDRRYNFDSHREDVVCLMELTKEEILDMYDEWLLCEDKRRRLVVCIVGNNHEGGDEEEGADDDGDDDDDDDEEDNEENEIDDDDDDMGIIFDNDNDKLGDEKVEEFHNICNGDTWGKIYG